MVKVYTTNKCVLCHGSQVRNTDLLKRPFDDGYQVQYQQSFGKYINILNT